MILTHIHQTIKDLYPDIDMLKDYLLIDYGDGEGPRIHTWLSTIYPEPTHEQLETQHPISVLKYLKEEKIKKIKEEASAQILAIMDETKQRNALAASLELVSKKVDGLTLTAAEQSYLDYVRTTWDASINPIRALSNTREAVVNLATTPEEIEAA